MRPESTVNQRGLSRSQQLTNRDPRFPRPSGLMNGMSKVMATILVAMLVWLMRTRPGGEGANHLNQLAMNASDGRSSFQAWLLL